MLLVAVRVADVVLLCGSFRGGSVRSASGLTVSATCSFMVVSSVVLCIIAKFGGFTCGTVVRVSKEDRELIVGFILVLVEQIFDLFAHM